MTAFLAALHAVSAGRGRGATTVDLSLMGALVGVAALATVALFDSRLFGLLG